MAGKSHSGSTGTFCIYKQSLEPQLFGECCSPTQVPLWQKAANEIGLNQLKNTALISFKYPYVFLKILYKMFTFPLSAKQCLHLILSQLNIKVPPVRPVQHSDG